MSRDKFQKSLSYWLGRSFVLKELEERGFSIHKHYDMIVAGQCPDGAGGDLDLYWGETAREYVCSRGLAKSWIREFPTTECYRSSYLDELARHRPRSPYFQRAPMHPCILAFETKRLQNEYALAVTAKLETLKAHEIEAHGIQPDYWNGTKEDVVAIFETLMIERGFRKQGKKYIKQDRNGLVFGSFIDFGGRPTCIHVPFRFFIAYAEMRHKRDVFDMRFSRIAEGFYAYELFKRPEAAFLGFRAHVEMIDVMSLSFSANT